MPSPFGTFYVPNISSDPTDGIGRWSEADFVTAVLKGTSPDGAHYFPAFPYASYQHATGRGRPRSLRLPEDARAGGRQAARSRRAVSIQHPPQRRHLEMAVHGRQALSRRTPRIRRRGIAAPISSTVSAIAPSATARAISSAASSRRNALPAGPIRKARAGCPTSPRRDLAEWSAKDIAYFLETGQTPDGDTAGGSMARVIRNTSQLSPEDRAAMAEYLKSLPPVEGPPRPKKAKSG